MGELVNSQKLKPLRYEKTNHKFYFKAKEDNNSELQKYQYIE